MNEVVGSHDQQSLASAFDAVPACLAFFDRTGMLAHANQAITRAWEEEPDGKLIKREVHDLARTLWSQLHDGVITVGSHVVELGAREVRLSSGRTYQIQASYIAADLFGRGSTLLLSVERPQAESLSDEVLGQRFGLTAREVGVARLLMEGKSNIQIAAAMCISPHTARTHTEHILQKLGARSRAEVGSILRRG